MQVGRTVRKTLRKLIGDQPANIATVGKAEIGQKLLNRRFKAHSAMKIFIDAGVCPICKGQGRAELKTEGKYFTKKCEECDGTGTIKKESNASKLFRLEGEATQGHAEYGDRDPVTHKEQESYIAIMAALEHAEEKYGDSRYTRALMKIAAKKSRNNWYKSMKEKHTDIEVAIMPSPFGGQPWKSREDGLQG